MPGLPWRCSSRTAESAEQPWCLAGPCWSRRKGASARWWRRGCPKKPCLKIEWRRLTKYVTKLEMISRDLELLYWLKKCLGKSLYIQNYYVRHNVTFHSSTITAIIERSTCRHNSSFLSIVVLSCPGLHTATPGSVSSSEHFLPSTTNTV